MKQKKLIALTLMLSLLSINKVYADCSQEEIKEFKKIADEYKVTYEFNITTKDYNITIYNPYPNKYAYIPDASLDMTKYITHTEESVTIGGVQPGKYSLKVINESGCENLKTITLSLASYNKYYNDPLCEGIEEFYLCQPTYDKEIDMETFKSRVKIYKMTKEKKETEKKDEHSTEKNILQNIKEHSIQIIVITIFITLTIITAIVTAKSIRKSRRLE